MSEPQVERVRLKLVAAEHRRCATCRSPLSGPFCSQCGQEVLEGRHTVAGIISGAFSRLLNLERGVLHTFLCLTLYPGQTIREYLGGRTVPYSHPAAYLLIAFAAFVLLSTGLVQGGDDRVFFLLIVPFIAIASRLVFWRADANFAEHLILVTYLVGQVALGWAVALLPLRLLTRTGPESMVPGALVLTAVAGIIYFIWAYDRFFDGRRWLSALWGAITLVLGISLWLGVFGVLIQSLRSATGT